MNKLFGTSSKKPEAPKTDINAPTLKDTSSNVIFLCNLDGESVVGPTSQSNSSQGRRVQRLTCGNQETNGHSQRPIPQNSQAKSAASIAPPQNVR